MSRTSDFSTINGIAKITWEVATETPLCIKAGSTSIWQQAAFPDGNPSKLRQVDAAYDFYKKGESGPNESTVADFYYDSYITGQSLNIRHRIPESSIRGALRNYTLKRLVPIESQRAELNCTMKHETTEDDQTELTDKNIRELQEALKTPGWNIIQNFFGLAAESGSDVLEDESAAGRLQISVGDLETLSESDYKADFIAGNFSSFKPGSTRGKMVLTTRNPIDRITHAAKMGGLHTFTELAKDNNISIVLRVINPVPADLGLVAFWEQEINSGFLRFGGLTGTGRGRLAIKSTDVRLFARTTVGFPGNLTQQNGTYTDILEDVFPETIISDWNDSKPEYLDLIKTQWNA